MPTQTLPKSDASPEAKAPAPTVAATPERWQVKLSRNPVVKLVDRREAEPARKWKAHKALADEVAQGFSTGTLFTLVQPGGKGWWVSEWTVVGQGKREADRRRAGQGKTLDAAVDAMLEHPSFHKSHIWAPEETAWSMLRRLF